MKAVQAYIDANDHDKGVAAAKKILGYEPTDGTMKMAEKRMAGIEAYLVPAPTVSKSITTTKKPSNVGTNIAKIVSAPEVSHVPIPTKLQWLGGGERVTWNGTSFTHEQTWIGASEWDTDLYEKA